MHYRNKWLSSSVTVDLGKVVKSNETSALTWRTNSFVTFKEPHRVWKTGQKWFKVILFSHIKHTFSGSKWSFDWKMNTWNSDTPFVHSGRLHEQRPKPCKPCQAAGPMNMYTWRRATGESETPLRVRTCVHLEDRMGLGFYVWKVGEKRKYKLSLYNELKYVYFKGNQNKIWQNVCIICNNITNYICS